MIVELLDLIVTYLIREHLMTVVLCFICPVIVVGAILTLYAPLCVSSRDSRDEENYDKSHRQ